MYGNTAKIISGMRCCRDDQSGLMPRWALQMDERLRAMVRPRGGQVRPGNAGGYGGLRLCKGSHILPPVVGGSGRIRPAVIIAPVLPALPESGCAHPSQPPPD